MFDFKHLTPTFAKASFFNYSYLGITFHALYFKIPKLSDIKSFLIFIKVIFIPKNDGIFLKKWLIGKTTNGQLFKKWAIGKANNGQLF